MVQVKPTLDDKGVKALVAASELYVSMMRSNGLAPSEHLKPAILALRNSYKNTVGKEIP